MKRARKPKMTRAMQKVFAKEILPLHVKWAKEAEANALPYYRKALIERGDTFNIYRGVLAEALLRDVLKGAGGAKANARAFLRVCEEANAIRREQREREQEAREQQQPQTEEAKHEASSD